MISAVPEKFSKENLFDFKVYNDLNSHELKYSVTIVPRPTHTKTFAPLCLDIRQVVWEIENGYERYMLTGDPETHGEIPYYIKENLDILIEKERSCLHTTRIMDTLIKKRNEIYPVSDEKKAAERSDFLKALAMLIKVLIAVNPGQEIIANNLEPDFKELYRATAEYNLAKSRTYTGGTELWQNPFDMKERISIIRDKIDEDEAQYTAFRISHHPDYTLNEDELKAEMDSWKYGLEEGIIKPIYIENKKVREALDLQINEIKVTCVKLFVNKTFDIEAKEETTLKEKAIKVFGLFDKLKYTNSNILKLFQAMFGEVCIRNMGVNATKIMEHLNAIINSPEVIIPELDLHYVGDIPESYKSCFVDVLSSRDLYYEPLQEILVIYEEKYGHSRGAVSCAVGGAVEGATGGGQAAPAGGAGNHRKSRKSKKSRKFRKSRKGRKTLRLRK